MKTIDLPLKAKSPDRWVEVVLADFANFLQDHAACERKAAALAMSFIAKYPDRSALIEPMVCLAREELEHFHQVFRLMRSKGITLPLADEKDWYVNEVLTSLRHGREERFLDRLIMSALVEARGYERFHLLAKALDDLELKDFYTRLADREAGHYKIFVQIASCYFSAEEIERAISVISEKEAHIMLKAPITARLH